MKQQTADLIKKHFDNNRFEFAPVDSGLSFNHDLSDDEIIELVQSEYGTSLTQSTDELFKVILKKLMNMGIEHAKKDN